MIFKVKTIKVFERQAKRLMKKFPSLKKELAVIIHELKQNPTKGIEIGQNCFKIRLSVAIKGKGKSGGARILTHLVYIDQTVFLLSIYNKSEIENLTDKEILELIKQIP